MLLWQGEFGEPGQKGSKGDKGEHVSEFTLYTSLESEDIIYSMSPVWIRLFVCVCYYHCAVMNIDALFVMKINELYLLAFSFFSLFFPPCFCLSSGSSRARREPRSSGSAGSTCEYNEISHSSHGCGVSVLAMSLPPAGCWWRARSQRSAGSVWAEGRRGLTRLPRTTRTRRPSGENISVWFLLV